MTRASDISPRDTLDAVRELNVSDVLAWFSPCCGDKTLPPAVNGQSSRFCRKCGGYYAPDLAVSR